MSKSIYVGGLVCSPSKLKYTQFNVMMSKDKSGQAVLSINDGITRFTIPFEQVLDAMMEWDESRKKGKDVG